MSHCRSFPHSTRFVQSYSNELDSSISSGATHISYKYVSLSPHFSLKSAVFYILYSIINTYPSRQQSLPPLTFSSKAADISYFFLFVLKIFPLVSTSFHPLLRQQFISQ